MVGSSRGGTLQVRECLSGGALKKTPRKNARRSSAVISAGRRPGLAYMAQRRQKRRAGPVEVTRESACGSGHRKLLHPVDKAGRSRAPRQTKVRTDRSATIPDTAWQPRNLLSRCPRGKGGVDRLAWNPFGASMCGPCPKSVQRSLHK